MYSFYSYPIPWSPRNQIEGKTPKKGHIYYTSYLHQTLYTIKEKRSIIVSRKARLHFKILGQA